MSAALALLLLCQGQTLWALVAFAALNPLLTSVLSLLLARIHPTGPPRLNDMIRLLPDALRLALRDLAGNACLPILQLLITACLDLTASGAFQIAARCAGLIDALAIAPIRFTALPRFSPLPVSEQAAALHSCLKKTAGVAFLVYLGAAALAPELLSIAVGPEHAKAAAPILPLFCAAGLLSALLVPINQLLTATGHLQLTLLRTLATLMAILLIAAPGLHVSLFAACLALPTAVVLITLIYVPVSARKLSLSVTTLLMVTGPAAVSGAIAFGAVLAVEVVLPAQTSLISFAAKPAAMAAIYVAALYLCTGVAKPRGVRA